MNYNTDGFNERSLYINNANDLNRIHNNGPSNMDNSFVKMRIEDNKPDIETVNMDKAILLEEARGDKDNFVLRNNNIRNINTKINPNNPVSNAMNRNRFKNF